MGFLLPCLFMLDRSARSLINTSACVCKFTFKLQTHIQSFRTFENTPRCPPTNCMSKEPRGRERKKKKREKIISLIMALLVHAWCGHRLKTRLTIILDYNFFFGPKLCRFINWILTKFSWHLWGSSLHSYQQRERSPNNLFEKQKS